MNLSTKANAEVHSEIFWASGEVCRTLMLDYNPANSCSSWSLPAASSLQEWGKAMTSSTPPIHSTVSWDSLHHTPAAELVARTKGFHVLPDLDLGYVSTTEQITVAIRILGMTLELRGRLNPTQASQLLCMGEGKGEHLQRSPKKCGRDWLAV